MVVDSELAALSAGLRDLAQDLGSVAQVEHEPLWLALDQGGHASRALVFDSAGNMVSQAFAAIDTQHVGEQVEHDPLQIVRSLQVAMHDALSALGADIDRVQAAGLATQRSSIVCWRADNGAPLSPVLSWQDRRNTALVTQLAEQSAQIQALTGLVLSPHYGASKIRWCLDNLPAVQQAAQQGQLRCGPLASYLLHALLQEQPHLVDPANASRTQLWSPQTGQWSSPLLQWFGVPQSVLPTPVPSVHDYGHLSFGERRIPLRVCTGDQAAVPFANGALDTHSFYLNLGTGAFVLAPLDHEVSDAAPLLRSVLYSTATQSIFAVEGTVNGAASALHWLAEHSALEVPRAATALRRGQLPQADIPLFINGVGGVGSPYWLPKVTSRFIGSEVANAGDDLAQLAAVIESIALLLNVNLRLMRQHHPAQQLLVGGGLSSCHYLCQCLADLTQLPVVRLLETELTARGLAYLVAGAPAHWRHTGGASLQPENYPELLNRQAHWLAQMRALARNDVFV